MSYEPFVYWSARATPNAYDHLRWWDYLYLQPLVERSETILDFGAGNGRTFPLYTGKHVHAVDIVTKYEELLKQKATDFHLVFNKYPCVLGEYDLAVLNKVLLHVEDPRPIIDEIKADVVFIATGLGSTTPHCFDHDYRKLLAHKRILTYYQRKNDVVIVYDNG